jgi:hypothetical protein
MRQIISGETPKVKIINRKSVDNFLDENKKLFEKLSTDNINCLYESHKIVNDPVLNYLNVTCENQSQKELKKLIRREFDVCEKIYPYLGDLFVNLFFDNFSIKNKTSFKFTRQKESTFLSTITHDLVKKIANIFFKDLSLEYFISVEKEKIDEIVMVKKTDLVFDLEFDSSYIEKYGSLVFEEYNFIIIDGMIDSIGEIHHLLHAASENKEPYVIFCYGINPEVKHTIITNNNRGITKVFPIDITVNESSLNILNDIAIISNDEVISATKGQTISQAVRNKLKKGKRIKIEKNRFTLKQLCSNQVLKNHRKFLYKRIDETDNDTNKAYLEKRYKRINTKAVSIHIPETLYTNNHFIRELDYFLRFLSNINKKMVKYRNINNKKFYYVPSVYIELIKEKKSMLSNMFENIEKLIVRGENNE